MGDVARKVMGDVPISYIEGVGGIRVSEDEIVEVGKHDVGSPAQIHLLAPKLTFLFLGAVVQTWPIDPAIQDFMYSQHDNETSTEII